MRVFLGPNTDTNTDTLVVACRHTSGSGASERPSDALPIAHLPPGVDFFLVGTAMIDGEEDTAVRQYLTLSVVHGSFELANL